MNGELARALQPQVVKVETALHDLDASNRDPEAHPLDALVYTGRVIAEQAALIDALTDLLDRRDPLNAECWHDLELQLQGRINRLAGAYDQASGPALQETGSQASTRNRTISGEGSNGR